MSVRVSINGFGRIGRNILRAIIESGRDDIVVVGIADGASNIITDYDTDYKLIPTASTAISPISLTMVLPLLIQAMSPTECPIASSTLRQMSLPKSSSAASPTVYPGMSKMVCPATLSLLSPTVSFDCMSPVVFASALPTGRLMSLLTVLPTLIPTMISTVFPIDNAQDSSDIIASGVSNGVSTLSPMQHKWRHRL